ncbi:TPA: hypothetical protein ACOEL2_002079 [Enterobacter hormaechei subsp. xiangfangensis]
MRLYKYIKKEHLDSFFSQGRVKIGSLYEYRNVEQYGNVIGDHMEGAFETILDRSGPYDIDLSTDSIESLLFRQNLDIDRRDIKITVEAGASIAFRQESPDFYIYCVTTDFNQNVMKEFDCDCCIEIINPELFFKALSEKIRHKAQWQLASKIAYRSKYTSYTQPHKFHQVITKSPEYAYQNELRGIWKPKGEIKSPLIVDVPKAIGACRIYKF